MINSRINTLVSKFNKHDIDGYIIPKNDDYFTKKTSLKYINWLYSNSK